MLPIPKQLEKGHPKERVIEIDKDQEKTTFFTTFLVGAEGFEPSTLKV
jgi:hypothetical protein